MARGPGISKKGITKRFDKRIWKNSCFAVRKRWWAGRPHQLIGLEVSGCGLFYVRDTRLGFRKVLRWREGRTLFEVIGQHIANE